MTMSTTSAVRTAVISSGAQQPCELACRTTGIREELVGRGFARIRASEWELSPGHREGLAKLISSARFLPRDSECQGGYRYRQYGRFGALPWCDLLEPYPAVWDEGTRSWVMEFTQPATLNSEERGRKRYFAALSDEFTENPLIQDLIRFDLSNSPFTADELARPIEVGVHLVRLEASQGRTARATPDRPHRDGEPFTWAHLVERCGVEGGDNYIMDASWADHPLGDVPESEIRARFTLDEPMDSYVVKDDLVAHHVEGVSAHPGSPGGWRTVLLIDFTPMERKLVMESA
jgi:hypothetical protein